MFLQGLKTQLTISIAGKTYIIHGSRIRNFQIQLHSYGFDAYVEFWFYQNHDEIMSSFIADDLMQVSFQVSQYFNAPDPAPKPIDIQGFVYHRDMKEVFVEVNDKQQDSSHVRYYQIKFKDAAQFVWQQHFPCKLYTDKTFQNVIDSEKGQYISIDGDWKELTTSYPMIFLGLLKQFKQPSFYDFMMWYCHSFNGVWSYDTAKNTYQISDSKSNEGEQKNIHVLDVEQLVVEFPQTPRYQNRILDASSDNPQTLPLEQQYAISGVEQDVYICTDIQKDVDDLQTRVKNRLITRKPVVKLVFKRFPTIDFAIGEFIDFASNYGWSSSNFASKSTYRVFEIFIDAKAAMQNPEQEMNAAYNSYNVDFVAKLEPKEETYRHYSPFSIPLYDVLVEGKIVSDEGEEDQKTYQIYEDEQTSQKQYKIKIPLFENQTVMAPFEPNLLPGYFYFPEDKDAKVLLALKLKSARIHRFLDWRLDSQLPQSTQGNNILFGLTTESQTSLNHVYKDNKPVFNISRKQDKDNQNLKMEEGVIVIETLDNSDESSG